MGILCKSASFSLILNELLVSQVIKITPNGGLNRFNRFKTFPVYVIRDDTALYLGVGGIIKYP